MKLSEALGKALNDQVNLEIASAHAYLAMAAYFTQTPLTGFARWMQVQSKEEMGHAQRFFAYLNDRGGKVRLQGVPQPKADFNSVKEVFEVSLAHEQKVSASINKIYEVALKEKDFPTTSFLKWFLDEQVEEEKNVLDMLSRLKLVGDNHAALFHLDQLAGRRAGE